MTSYAYLHARPGTMEASGIFYVGKGKLSRALSFNPKDRNPLHANIVNKHGSKNILIGTIECSNESLAFSLEKGLIKCLRRMGVFLANFTDGGEGASGAKRSEETKLKMSVIHKELAKTNGLGEKMRKWALEKGSAVHLGRVRPKETGERISKALTGKKLSESHKIAVSNGQLTKGFRWMKREDLCLKVCDSDIVSKSAEGFVFGRIMKSMYRTNGNSN